MHFAIVEDFEPDADLLGGLIRDNCAGNGDTAELSFYRNAEAFLAEFRSGLFSAVFLDIIMGGITGIDAAWKIREKDSRIPVVFITSEMGFSLESYGIHALDYLVKPVKPLALDWCMERIRETMASPTFIEVREIVETRGFGPRKIFLDELIYVESVRNGLLFHTKDGEVRARLSMADMNRLLPKTGRFFECGRGLIVNFSHVSQITAQGEILLTNGQTLFCSRRRLREAREAYAAWRSETLYRGGVY